MRHFKPIWILSLPEVPLPWFYADSFMIFISHLAILFDLFLIWHLFILLSVWMQSETHWSLKSQSFWRNARINFFLCFWGQERTLLHCIPIGWKNSQSYKVEQSKVQSVKNMTFKLEEKRKEKQIKVKRHRNEHASRKTITHIIAQFDKTICRHDTKICQISFLHTSIN